MRLGGPVQGKFAEPEAWIRALRERGYSAAYVPSIEEGSAYTIDDFAAAAAKADIVIAEVGAWSNPISPDAEIRAKAIAHCQEKLALAEQIGAHICVNIAGSRGEKWDGPHPDNLTGATFELIVDTVRTIIDAVKPKRTFYTLETMPWMYPDSAESYLRLIEAIDRPGFGCHFDPVNLICSPQLYFGNAAMIKDFVRQLGPYIKGCHAKDITLASKLTVHLDEARPGLGGLDYGVLLTELDKLGPDMKVMLEHLPDQEEYRLAAEYVRSVAGKVGVVLR
jgi:sugar phosphate isomerase/epimerase